MKTITLTMPLDMHLHLRDNEMLETVAPLTSYSFSGALVMPNLVPPVTSKEMVKEYKKRIKHAIGRDDFEPYMTLFYQNYSRAFLEDVAEEITAIKLYPSGVTTNSEGGVSSFDIESMRPTLEAMADLGIVLSVHGETNGFVMDREAEFMSVYEMLASNFPKLKIVMEHITTAEAVAMLDRYANLYATITVHHLMITLDDVAGGLLRPHLFCKPIAKRPEDRAALLKIALDAHPKVMFGSDSAPHPKHTKESCGCGAGVFTAPIALQLLCEVFDAHDKLDNLQAFVSDNAQQIYGICAEFKEVVLIKHDFVVPEIYGSVVPMKAGETLRWAIERVD
ncbi:dihydroorotase [Sulfuricurvum sp.]|uniref:dihydroorotase n=1 Tax=Sulfuricurvum sp. TaxID=2025608 RepID=UPI00260D9FAA|nr:dihydroorotase [Sulfuricurvum sp.]MDD2266065.1 dihydroorotase [Sulfuricurvum sp.]MDD2784359.1 dihydroorotase [Sulfuricurvum sp.]HZF71428.1 dihydroorotase [Sulfuricurvum sp.]